jgi:hypothetical protein
MRTSSALAAAAAALMLGACTSYHLLEPLQPPVGNPNKSPVLVIHEGEKTDSF